MLRTMRELNAPPKIVFASVSSNQCGSLRLTARFPTEIDDWMLFGRCTKNTLRPLVGGGGGKLGLATSARVQAPKAFSTAAIAASGSTAPTISTNALLGR